MEIPMLRIRRPRDRLIFNMGVSILVRRCFCIEKAPMINLFYTANRIAAGDVATQGAKASAVIVFNLNSQNTSVATPECLTP